MPGEETESVGGISIEASVSNQLGGLSALESTLKSEATRLSAAFVINPTVGGLSTQVQQQSQQARRMAQQAAPIEFRAAALPTPSFSGRSTAAIELINKELAKTGEILDEITGEPVPIASIQRATRATQALASATGQVVQPEIVPTISDAELRAGVAGLTTEIKALATELSKAMVIIPTVAPPPEAEVVAAAKAAQAPPRPPRKPPTAVGTPEEGDEEEAPKPKRKKLVARDIGTEAEERIYTFEPEPEKEAQAEAKASRAREAAAAQNLRQRETRETQTERQFVAALQAAQPPPAPTVFTARPEEETAVEARREAEAERQREAVAAQVAQRGLRPTTVERDFVAALQAAQQVPTRFSPEMERELRELSYENQQQGGAGRISAGLISGRSPEDQRRYEEQQRQQQAQAQRQALAPPRQNTPEERAELSARLERQNRQFVSGAASRAADEAALATAPTRGRAGTGAARGRGLDEGDLARRAEQQIATSEAQRLTAARTARTFASGLGGFFLGQTRQQTEASIELRRNEQELQIARRRLYDPQIIGSARAYRQAQEEVAVAETKVAASLEKVQSFTGGVSAARTLVAVTAAGAAFGIGLKAVDFAISAVGAGFSNLVEIQTGFVATSSRVTGELAKQTLALHGNVDAALAQAEATAGISAAAGDAINDQIKLTTQTKAGAIAQQQASDLFRAGQGAGGAQTGLFGGFGGLFGTSLFAQQLGGGRGFSELVSEDLRALSQSRGANPLESIGGGVSFVTDEQFRKFIESQAQDQGNPFGAISRIPGGIGDVIAALNPFGNQFGNPFGPPPPTPEQEAQQQAQALPQVTAYLNDLNAAAKRGALALGQATVVTYEKARSDEEVARATAAAAAAGDTAGVTLAQTARIVVKVNGEVARSAEEYRRAVEQADVGRGIVDPEQLRRQQLALQRYQFQVEAPIQAELQRNQQQREFPAFIRSTERQQQFALQFQQPAQQALANLAQPLLPVGTGIAAEDQASVNEQLTKSQDLQDDLNAGYERGRQILATTYQVPLSLLNQIKSVGTEIAGLQAGIANQQANYQVAQFNFQLHIARRTLSDINAITGQNLLGAGQSYLGVLERQNLALSRQAQLLSFSLAQRQINFQQALAGFQAPGVTPEERQANVKQAQIEADFAQKQLDIQRQMFGNQVQIVDIGNLRQGADLAAQIGLLLQGRQLTIDAAAAQEQINLLQTQVGQFVAQAGTYLTKIDAQVSQRMNNIFQLEATAGRAMYGIAYSVLDATGVLLEGLNAHLTQFGGPGPTAGSGLAPTPQATGGLYSVSSPTGIEVGEAGTETVAILRNPRPMAGGLGNGGGNISITFGDLYVRDDADIQKIAQAVMTAMGQRASLVGLRLTG